VVRVKLLQVYIFVIQAGADISQMMNYTFKDCLDENFLANWKRIYEFKKPLIAAINGYAV
jgi:enoyl-CoA hydratase/carnithine racemase